MELVAVDGRSKPVVATKFAGAVPCGWFQAGEQIRIPHRRGLIGNPKTRAM